MNYYNENDPKAAAWLRELIAAHLIPEGHVDERSIEQVSPDDLRGYIQCHFFAGIGGWSYALRLADWPATSPVWTGSCPCQPFSAAGQRKVDKDKRHLWPAFRTLIAKCGPPVVFGEQVASRDGRIWLAGVRSDLEALGFAVGGADLCAASLGAPHRRQRLYFVAHSKSEQEGDARFSRQSTEPETLAYARHEQSRGSTRPSETEEGRSFSDAAGLGEIDSLGDSDSTSEHERPPSWQQSLRDKDHPRNEAVGDSSPAGLQRQWSEYQPSGERCSGLAGLAVQAGVPQWNGPTIAIECSDGARRVSAQPNAFPLAHGVPARMVKLRGSGNAIVPQVAAKFIEAFLLTKLA